MRVIAGSYRSRPLVAPKGMGTRPTSDRLRETLFNILEARAEGERVAGSRFADLYAGTGAVGIEAISRGAAQVWFAERGAAALAAIRANLKALGIARGFAIEERGVGALLERMVKSAAAGGAAAMVDIVYLDPPWEAEAEYERALQLLGSARGRVVLAPGAVVVAEHGSKAQLAEWYGELVRTRMVKQGDAALSFYAIAAE
jgi:16S rRNA (guanine(966)-N(2))-methyltransferase RsmD